MRYKLCYPLKIDRADDISASSAFVRVSEHGILRRNKFREGNSFTLLKIIAPLLNPSKAVEKGKPQIPTQQHLYNSPYKIGIITIQKDLNIVKSARIH